MILKDFLFGLCNTILKSNIEFDENIPLSYLIIEIFDRCIMLLRGEFKKLFMRKAKGILFCGKKTKIRAAANVSMGSRVTIKNNVYIDALSVEGIEIGDGVSIGDNTRIQCTGTIQSIGKGLKIGSGSGIGNDCFFGAAGGIVIGENVIMGQNVRFHSENHNFDEIDVLIKNQGVSHKGIFVGNNCWIGAGTVFLDGSSIGNGCVVGANTLINKQYPDNAVVLGCPGKIVRFRGNR